MGSIVGGGFSKNEAATSLLLIDNRSGVQVSSATGSAANHDFSLFGGMFAGAAAGGAARPPGRAAAAPCRGHALAGTVGGAAGTGGAGSAS